MSTPGAIDDHPGRLLLVLRGRPGGVRRVLAETEDHLRDAAAREIRAGMTPGEAERRAVARFGPPGVVAHRFGRVQAGLMAAIGLLAIGASGLVSLGMRPLWGDGFVAGDPVGVTYTTALCDDLREYHPSATTCRAAAAAHHTDEVVAYRTLAGVLGAGVLGAWWWRRRRAAARPAATGGLGQLVAEGHDGAGQWLSGGLVSLAVGAWFALALLRLLAARARLARA